MTPKSLTPTVPSCIDNSLSIIYTKYDGTVVVRDLGVMLLWLGYHNVHVKNCVIARGIITLKDAGKSYNETAGRELFIIIVMYAALPGQSTSQ